MRFIRPGRARWYLPLAIVGLAAAAGSFVLVGLVTDDGESPVAQDAPPADELIVRPLPTVGEAQRRVSYTLLEPALLPDGFERNATHSREFPGFPDRGESGTATGSGVIVTSQSWLREDVEHAYISLEQNPALRGIGSLIEADPNEDPVVASAAADQIAAERTSDVTIRGQTGTMIVSPPSAEREYGIVSLFWRDAGLGYSLDASLVGSMTPELLLEIAESLKPLGQP